MVRWIKLIKAAGKAASMSASLRSSEHGKKPPHHNLPATQCCDRVVTVKQPLTHSQPAQMHCSAGTLYFHTHKQQGREMLCGQAICHLLYPPSAPLPPQDLCLKFEPTEMERKDKAKIKAAKIQTSGGSLWNATQANLHLSFVKIQMN